MARLLLVVAVALFAASALPARCYAQLAHASAGAHVGDVEGPMQDGQEGGYAAFARKSNDSPGFGSGSAGATVIGSDISVNASFSSEAMFTWTAGGGGLFMSQDTVQVIDQNHQAGDQYFIRFNVIMSWKLSGDEVDFLFGVNELTSSWSTVGGPGQNDFHLDLGPSGYKRAVVEIDLENLAANPNLQFAYTATLPFTAGATAGARAMGGSGSVKASLHTTKPDLLKRPAGGGEPFVLHPWQDLNIESESGEGDTFTGDPTAIGLTPISADFDLDGDVNGNDFLIWQRNATTAFGAEQSDGNATLGQDGDVDGLDLDIWKQQFGMSGVSGGAVAVPEPAAWALILLGAASIAARRRRS